MRTVTLQFDVVDGVESIVASDSDGQFVDVQRYGNSKAYFVSELHGDDSPVAHSAEITYDHMLGAVLHLMGLINDEALNAMKEHGF